ncbi:hypothetical protein M408DRAFT_12133 [Serendipita vermifera MAFF 305830]|uniref:glutathione transferase n=1 Tax=Serendipita vermifera MAFF 305830 TaxID=933852 RepID=A0A0C3ASI5_SERVB|nr:hypothetical protein M408DRAFT_12133 [Serendipita vermifera MAFF 305830]
MVLKLNTAVMTACGQRVAAILHEKEVPYELIEPDWANKELRSESWLEKHPFGQMPYIDDEGFILFESRAISRYIATKYASSGTPLLPSDTSDLKVMALLDQAISIETSNFDPHAGGLMMEKVFKGWGGKEADPILVAKYEEGMVGKLDGFEKLLAKQKYMAGDSLTFVDFFYLPYGTGLEKVGYDYLTNESKYPNITLTVKAIHGIELRCMSQMVPSLSQLQLVAGHGYLGASAGQALYTLIGRFPRAPRSGP